jgi:hypothetical protein
MLGKPQNVCHTRDDIGYYGLEEVIGKELVYCRRHEESGEMNEMEEFYPWWWLMRDGGAVVCWWAVWPVIDFTPHIDLLVGTHVVFIPYLFAL